MSWMENMLVLLVLSILLLLEDQFVADIVFEENEVWREMV